MYSILSSELQVKIERFKTASIIYNDIASMWEGVQSSELGDPYADSDSMRKLVEDCVMRRLSQFYKLKADIGREVLTLAIDENIIALESDVSSKNNVIDAVDYMLSKLDENHGGYVCE